jgi:hypothetical protein
MHAWLLGLWPQASFSHSAETALVLPLKKIPARADFVELKKCY